MKGKWFLPGLLASVFLAGLFFLLVQFAWARPNTPDTAIMVTTTNDVIASDGQCALREAIIAANTDSSFNDCPAGSGADSISFDSNLPLPAIFSLSIPGTNEDLSFTGDLDIQGTLTITGTGSGNIILDGQGIDRVLDIRPGAHATISGVTVRNGSLVGTIEGSGIRVLASLDLSNSTVTGNHTGGIFNNGGGMTLTAVNVTDNSGSYGVYNLNQGILTFNGGQVSGNRSGGIANASATATVSNLVISDNSGGSGVSNTGATLSHLTLSHSSVISNTATNGGGVFSSGVGAITDILDTTITSNTATASGGGIYNNGSMSVSRSTLDHNHARSGGGIDHSGTRLHMTNDTISSNVASNNGGGLYNRGSATLTHVTLSGNTANGPDTGGNILNDEASLTLQNSIVANSDTDGNCFNNSGFVTSSGNNLDDGNTCAFDHAGDLVNTNPLLGPLQDNGGPTLTHALSFGSPAIDHGNSAFCPATDQRGLTRLPTACDIGAYEAEETADLAISATAPVLVSVNGIMTYTVSVLNYGPGTANAVVVTDTLPAEVGYVDASMSGGGGCVYGSAVSCSLPTLTSGSSLTVTIIVSTPVTETVIVNHAQVTLAAPPDLNPENNVVTTTTAVAVIRYNFLPLIVRN
ncbi:MAG: choice-of-anchor Q domain-containing protein [Anaerolineae bacterium]